MSDYSGQHRKSRYYVTSILVFDLESSAQWEYNRRGIRDKFLRDGRRMSFKRLRDRRRAEALVPLLRAANTITGVCATFAISKKVGTLCTRPEDFDKFSQRLNLRGKWNSKSFEHVVRLTHFVSLLVAGLSQPGQHIYWISDEDPFFANTRRSQDVAHLVSSFTSHYVAHQLGELGVGTTQIDEGDLLEEDLAAIPDLVAGAVAEIATAIAKENQGRIPIGLTLSLPTDLAPKTEILADWIADDTQSLKRPIVVFDKTKSNALSVYRFSLG
jgi:hypothetical protein